MLPHRTQHLPPGQSITDRENTENIYTAFFVPLNPRVAACVQTVDHEDAKPNPDEGRVVGEQTSIIESVAHQECPQECKNSHDFVDHSSIACFELKASSSFSMK